MKKESFLNFIKGFKGIAQEKIAELAQTNLNNEEKKAKLDDAIVAFIENFLLTSKVNVFVKLLIKKLVLPNVDEVTQLVFDLLKAKISGVTPDEVKEDVKGEDAKGEDVKGADGQQGGEQGADAQNANKTKNKNGGANK